MQRKVEIKDGIINNPVFNNSEYLGIYIKLLFDSERYIIEVPFGNIHQYAKDKLSFLSFLNDCVQSKDIKYVKKDGKFIIDLLNQHAKVLCRKYLQTDESVLEGTKYDNDFLTFWEAYDLDLGKRKAYQAYIMTVSENPDLIDKIHMAAIADYNRGRDLRPSPANWLLNKLYNDKSYKDEIDILCGVVPQDRKLIYPEPFKLKEK